MNKSFLEKELKYCSEADKIVVGLSGGADSVAMTHILCSAFGPEKLLCAHVNHMIRGPEADRDEDFVRKFCESLGIELVVVHKDIPALSKEWKLGSEEAGRKVRYELFENLASGDNDIICTAHNADDNAETVLMNIARGSGLKGVCGIPQKRGKIFRPILRLSRQEVEEYCKVNKLYYVTDSSNLEDSYNRNIIRHHVIPYLKSINSSVVENIFRLSEAATSDETLLNLQASELLAVSRCSYGLKAEKLSEAPNPVLSRALITYISEFTEISPERQHIHKIIELIHDAGSVDIPGGFRVSVSQGILVCVKKQISEIDDIEVLPDRVYGFQGKQIIISDKINYSQNKIHNLLLNNCVDCDKIKNNLTVGSRREGDEFTFVKRKITKSLKKLFNEMKIPSLLRQSIAVIHDGDEVVFVEGIGVNSSYRVTSDTESVIEIKVSK
ncbi:MAG: tRNA lysidine(34) synthetase TilS [Clostridia bacterium]|nr:tRNA lysidine(34) synthetase TilS [Clostridia bacterium]